MDLSPKMFRDIPKLVKNHYTEGNFNWPMIIYVSVVHIAALVGVSKISRCSAQTLLWAFCLWPIRYAIISREVVPCRATYMHIRTRPLHTILIFLTVAILFLSFYTKFSFTVALVSQSEFIDCGLTDPMRRTLSYDSLLCCATRSLTKDRSTIGHVTTEYTTNSQKRRQTHTTPPEDFSMLT